MSSTKIFSNCTHSMTDWGQRRNMKGQPVHCCYLLVLGFITILQSWFMYSTKKPEISYCLLAGSNLEWIDRLIILLFLIFEAYSWSWPHSLYLQRFCWNDVIRHIPAVSGMEMDCDYLRLHQLFLHVSNHCGQTTRTDLIGEPFIRAGTIVRDWET